MAIKTTAEPTVLLAPNREEEEEEESISMSVLGFRMRLFVFEKNIASSRSPCSPPWVEAAGAGAEAAGAAGVHFQIRIPQIERYVNGV